MTSVDAALGVLDALLDASKMGDFPLGDGACLVHVELPLIRIRNVHLLQLSPYGNRPRASHCVPTLWRRSRMGL